jgi:FAD/FMN-containing dehydrogenase
LNLQVSISDEMQAQFLAPTSWPANSAFLRLSTINLIQAQVVFTDPPYNASSRAFAELRAMVNRFLESLLASGTLADDTIAANEGQATSFWRIREAMVEAEFRYGRHLRIDVSVPTSSIDRFLVEAGARLNTQAPAVIVLPMATSATATSITMYRSRESLEPWSAASLNRLDKTALVRRLTVSAG